MVPTRSSLPASGTAGIDDARGALDASSVALPCTIIGEATTAADGDVTSAARAIFAA